MDSHVLSRAFTLYAELLQLHGQDERLADWLSGAAYRIRNLETDIEYLFQNELAANFRPEMRHAFEPQKATVPNTAYRRPRVRTFFLKFRFAL